MRNAEHYKDPTAAYAVKEAAKGQPLQYVSTPVYVSHKAERRFPYPSTKVGEMNMPELQPYIHNCAKAKMNPLTCVECKPGCAFGKRAVELMERDTSPRPAKSTKRGVGMRIKSMREYQAAIRSGDVMKYALDHAKSSDPKKAKAAAVARVAFWRKNYGGLIKEEAEPDKKQVFANEEHPRPSRKISSGHNAASNDMSGNSNVAMVLANKMNTLMDSFSDIRKHMNDLREQEESIIMQINSLKETARVLGIDLD